jgi:hypothetical protein
MRFCPQKRAKQHHEQRRRHTDHGNPKPKLKRIALPSAGAVACEKVARHDAKHIRGAGKIERLALLRHAKAEEGGPATRLAPILPLVLAQDKDRWKTSTHFHDLFIFPQGAWAAVQACTPDFAFRLLQLVDLPYEDIHGTPEGILTPRSLKAEPLGELFHDLVWDRAVITGVSREAVERFFHYVLNANVDTGVFQEKVVQQESEKLTELAMTLADRIREEGLQKGLQTGLQKGRQEGEIHSRRQALLDVLEVRFAPLPEGLREALSGVSELDRLEKLLKVAVICPDLESFTSGL